MTRSSRRPRPAGTLPIREPQLATLVDQPPEGDAWLHEPKYDGYRIIAERTGADVHLWTRSFLDWTASYRVIADAISTLPCRRVVLDGELAVVMPDGRTSFQALQHADAASGLTYFAFDLLESDDGIATERSLEQRKERLRALLAARPHARLVYSDHQIGKGAELFRVACEAGLEGIVSKRRDQPYTPGRGPSWVKTKCIQRQELVIAGWTEPEGKRHGIGALLVGYYVGGDLVYAGKVGTGFSAGSLTELRAALDELATSTCPFEPAPKPAWTGPGVHWAKPTLVAEVAFAEWTNDGRLRHPSFKGLRRDKLASAIGRDHVKHARPVQRAPRGPR